MELFCDRATYYKSDQFTELCRSNNVIPQYNEAKEGSTHGLAERHVGLIKERAALALQTANLNNQFFGLAAAHGIFMKNRSPQEDLKLNGRRTTPFELWKGYKPSVAALPAFGTPVTVKVDKNASTQGKDHQSPIRGIFAGFTLNSNSYYIVQLETFSGSILDDSNGKKVKVSEQSPTRVHLDTYWQHPLTSIYPPSIIRDKLYPVRMRHIHDLYNSKKSKYFFDTMRVNADGDTVRSNSSSDLPASLLEDELEASSVDDSEDI